MSELTPKERDRLGSITRVVTLVVTNTSKIAGIYVGVHEIAIHSAAPNALVLAYSTLLMAGGQFSETLIIGFIERFFGLKGGDGK